VVVADSGIEENVALGDCTNWGSTNPRVHPSCRVLHYLNLADFDTLTTTDISVMRASNGNHGTNVAAIIAATASHTKLISMNIKERNGSITDATMLGALHLSRTLKFTFGIGNIVAINLSVGRKNLDHIRNPTTHCDNVAQTRTAVEFARAAGIHVVASSGNDGFNSLEEPACVSGVVSVGAVHDASIGSVPWWLDMRQQYCTDNSAPDLMACGSNGSSLLTLLAPGVRVNAGGIVMSGNHRLRRMWQGLLPSSGRLAW
jgi:subtilisin family serine protease